MPEADALKTIIQGGSFAVLVTILVWIMFKLEPRMSGIIADKDKQHAVTITRIVEENRAAMETLMTRLTEMVQKSHDDCREERKERDEAIAKEMKLNREARHDVANQVQRVVAEMYELYDVKRTVAAPNQRPTS